MNTLSSLIMLTATLVAGQRPSFAGTRPIGFPETPNRTTTASLDNRFGTTERLPLEANGDRDLVDRLSKLPVDKQPFWFINWQALEANRKNPQTYPQRPNVFVDPFPSIPGSITYPDEPSNSNSGSGSSNSGSNAPSSGTQTTVPNTGDTQLQTEDRFGSLDSGIPNSGTSAGNSNSSFVKPNIQSGSGSSGNTNGGNGVQQTTAQTQAPVIKITDYYPQQTNYQRPGGYGG